MSNRITPSRQLPLWQREEWRIAGIYFVVSSAWIMLSDSLLGLLPLRLDEVVWFSAAKGMGFVAFTTLLLFLLIRRAWLRRQALESAIHQSEQYLREILLASPAVCYRLRYSNDLPEVVWVSANSSRILGYPPQNIASADEWLALIHPDDRGRVQKAVEQVRQSRRFCHEYRVRHAQGHYLWVYDELCLSEVEHNDFYFVGAIIDISEQRRAQERLQLNSAVIDTIQNGVIITDPQGSIQFVNPAFTAITGYSEVEVKGSNPRLLNSGHHAPEFFTRMWQAIATDGHWSGEIMNRRKNGQPFIEWLSISRLLDDKGNTQHYIGTFSDISRLKNTEQRVQELENFDPVSQLPNRKVLLQRIALAVEECVKNGTHLAVLCVDIIDFKKVNDSFGHPVGDQVIRTFGQRLAHRLREKDCVSRASGDKFFLLLDRLPNPEGVNAVARDVLELMRKPVSLPDMMDIYLDVAVGICLFPEDGQEAEILLRNAEIASNHAKFKGRNLACYYSADLTASASKKFELEARLRQALQLREFVMHYQPVVNVSTGRMTGAEALIRWQPAGEKMVSPAEFIPLAEETGLIVPMGEWILREVAHQIRQWRAAGLNPGVIAVNLSARQIAQPSLGTELRDIIQQHQIPAESIELEITETSLMSDAGTALDILDVLHTIGCKIAIDDFGTGYSSLAYLKRFPIDKLKIDRGFVMDMQEKKNREIVHAIISMAQALKLEVQAEGVETPEQLDWLQTMHCDAYQGYLFSKPVPAEQFEVLLRNQGNA